MHYFYRFTYANFKSTRNNVNGVKLACTLGNQLSLLDSKMATRDDQEDVPYTRLELHHSHTHTTRNSNTKHLQHNNPSTNKHHPPTHKQQNDNNIIILQININGIRNKIEVLKKLVYDTQTDMITVQETKLTQKSKTTKTHTLYQ